MAVLSVINLLAAPFAQYDSAIGAIIGIGIGCGLIAVSFFIIAINL